MPGADVSEWNEEPLVGPIRIDPRQDVAELLRRVGEYLTRSGLGSGGLQISRGLTGATEMRFGDGSLKSSLLVRSVSGGVEVSVAGVGEKAGQVEPWAEALDWARRNLGAHQEFHWYAVISANGEWLYDRMPELESGCRIGGIRLTPAGVFTQVGPIPYAHHRRAEAPAQIVVADGVAHAHDVFTAIEQASRRLRVVCGLLALVSGVPWVLRNPPTMFAEKFDPASIDVSAWGAASRGEDPMFRTVNVTSAVDGAFSVAGKKPWLADLVGAYHEALELSIRHESFAAIAFVSIVEEIGNRKVRKLPRCGDCGAVTGSGERFRESLRRVLPAENAEVIGNWIYDLRSRTAHSGRLHGRENSFGWSGPNEFFGNEKTAAFPTLLHQVRLAAGRLLRTELGLEIGK